MPRAIVSVYEKEGVAKFARGLAELGYEVVSTGGTARALREAGLEVTEVSEVTGFAEIMDGRVKTLHPAIAAGILARRSHAEDLAELEASGIEPIDVVAVNLYPFERTVSRSDVKFEEALEQIDIGGPTLLRAAAKNHADVIVVCDPADYDAVLKRLQDGVADSEWRRSLAAKVFRHTSHYDAAICEYLETEEEEAPEIFPSTLSLRLEKVQTLRYGENPDQDAAFYRLEGHEARGLAALVKHHGKELSYNNLLDLDGALLALAPFARSERPTCAILKHTTPCGIARADRLLDAYRRALATDPVSAFGSVVAVTHPVDAETAEAMGELFIECLLAPSYSDAAMERLTGKKNIRILSFPGRLADFLDARSHLGRSLEFRGVPGGALLQTREAPPSPDGGEEGWEVATHRAPTPEEMRDLRFAWSAIWSVKSNAILLARDEQAIGIGAGQMSRVDASRLAGWKASEHGHRPVDGCVLASDAFFPFRDGVDAAAEAGVTAIVQPGGSIRDKEVIQAADKHGLAMVFTGRRLFRH